MRKGLLAMTGALLLGACSVFGVRSGTEQVNYEVVQTLQENVEIRRYPERAAAEVTLPGSAGRNRAFQALFDYISGANQSQQKIAMTAPVEVGSGEQIEMTAPVETQSGGGQLTMRFFLPASYTAASAPVPRDLRVEIVPLPPETLAVLRFTGSTGAHAIQARAADLEEVINGSPWQPTGDVRAFFYDPPWTLPFLRRNEVAVPVTR